VSFITFPLFCPSAGRVIAYSFFNLGGRWGEWPTAFLVPYNLLLLLVAWFHTNIFYQILTTGLVILHHKAYKSSRSSNLICLSIIVQDATIYSLFISVNYSTCFGWYLHPSSGAHITVSTASGISVTVTATCR
jgi:hypothetical protein